MKKKQQRCKAKIKELKDMDLHELYETIYIPWDEMPVDIALNVRCRFGLKMNDPVATSIDSELKKWKHSEAAQHGLTLISDIYAELHSRDMRRNQRRSDYEVAADKFLKADKKYREAFSQLLKANLNERHFTPSLDAVQALNQSLNHFQLLAVRCAFNPSLYPLEVAQEPSRDNKKTGRYRPQGKVGPPSQARIYFAISAMVSVVRNCFSISQEKAIKKIQPLLTLIGYKVNNDTIREKILPKAPKEMFTSLPSLKVVNKRFKDLALDTSVNNSRNKS